jgi:hypothetical protein
LRDVRGIFILRGALGLDDMPTYRIFTNDRRLVQGIPMYSCLKEVEASSSEIAIKECPRQFDAPYYAPAKVIQWPESTQSDDEKDWLKKHVYA